jgi:hypothetical protein
VAQNICAARGTRAKPPDTIDDRSSARKGRIRSNAAYCSAHPIEQSVYLAERVVVISSQPGTIERERVRRWIEEKGEAR